MAWGINEGVISKKEYLPVVMKAWNALMTESVHPNGFLGYVQGTGKEPKDSQPVGYDNVPNFEDFGLGCFLLAGSEVYKLQKSMEPKPKEPKAEKPAKPEKSKGSKKVKSK
jgi:unsaturated rhamnogalacturonyl hydrolase